MTQQQKAISVVSVIMGALFGFAASLLDNCLAIPVGFVVAAFVYTMLSAIFVGANADPLGGKDK